MKKTIIVLLMTLLSTSVVYASSLINASDVVYDNTNSNLFSTNVQGALDELIQKANQSSNRNWSIQFGRSGTATQYMMVFKNNNIFSIEAKAYITYNFSDGAIRTSQVNSSPFPVTYTYLKSGYYNINGSWTYKEANTTTRQNYYDYVFWYEDLQQ
jgi:hypothetical protein